MVRLNYDLVAISVYQCYLHLNQQRKIARGNNCADRAQCNIITGSDLTYFISVCS